MRQREEIQEVLRRPTGKLISIAIVLFWMVMLAFLFRREGIFPFAPARAKVVSPRVVQPSNSWMGVYLGEAVSGASRVGFVNIATNPSNRDGHVGVDFSLTAQIRLMLLSTATDIYLAGTAWIPQDESRAEFDFKVRSYGHTMRVSATFENGLIDGSVFTAGESIPFKFPVGKELVLSGAMGTATLNLPSLEPDQEVVVDTFDPMTFSVGKAHIKCLGRETIDAGGTKVECKIVTTTLNGMASKVWVTAEEEIVRVETPFGFSLRRITQQEALASPDGGDNKSILRSMSIPPTGKKPFRGAKRMAVALRGTDSGISPPSDETQTGQGNLYTVTSASEPARTDSEQPSQDEFLKSDTFVQSSHPKIKAMAERIVGGETDPWKKSLLISDWVYKNLKKLSVFSIPSALEVLESREGDCNEHTVLFTALARAAGVPARIDIGLVWSDTLNGFYYHAWPEVFVGRWIWMEPTLGQPIADATHLKLLSGDIQSWTLLLPYLGRLEIEVMEIG